MAPLSSRVTADPVKLSLLHAAGRSPYKPLLIALLFQLAVSEAVGQAFPIFNGTDNTCVGAFLDSGGEGAVGYSDNENFTYTICPDSPNEAISLNFLTFNLSNAGAAPVDRMFIYDGNSTAAPTLGNYAGTALQGVTVSASPLNSSGCLTIVFQSNNTGTGVFAASITCYTPCQRPTAVATMGQPGPLRICVGDAVNFNSAGSFAAPGFAIASRRWEFGDGTVLNNAPVNASHTYTQPGAYTAQLYLVDNNGCASTNRVDLEVWVGTEPDFMGTGGDLLGCVGETLCLDAVVNATTWNELPGNDLGNGVFLPDQVGSCFNSEITFTQFAPGQTLNSVNDLLTVCMNMEHSFMGDLVVNIISPTGQTVTMHQQGGGATFLGVPIDNDLQPNAQGDCFNYCFSPTATNGTWVDNAGATLPAGTYESLNNLNGLVGSGLNGTWSLQICDLWASDNGFVCDWSIDFDPSLFPDLVEFTPVYGTDCDSSSWSGPNVTSTSADCQGICITPPGPGAYPYTYSVTDDFGCTFDTTVVVTVIPGPQVTAGPDASTCSDPVQLNASITSGGFPTSCIYELRLRDSFGDGWTAGSSITVIVNGVPSTWTLDDGALVSINIPVTDGATIVLDYDAALLWNGEQGFTLFNSSGVSIYNSPNGPPNGVAWSGTASCPGGGFVYSWSPTIGLSNPNIANPMATVAGTTEYCVTAYQVGHPDCPSTDCMTITVDNTVDAGSNGSITICSSSPSFDLFPLIGGTPTSGGAWTAPGGAAHPGTFQPGSDAPGAYTYTITGSGACGSASATSTVTVAVNPIPDAGANSTITLCSTDAPQDLLSALGGAPTPGGQWSGPGGVPFANPFDPASDPAGTYTYSVNGAAPCPNAAATVTIIINAPPTAGDDASLSLCASDTPAQLLNVIGAAPGGTWTGPSTLDNDTFDPGSNIAGTYTYTLPGVAPCPSADASVVVSISTPVDAGTDGAITLCSTAVAVDLFTSLGGAPGLGGSWTGPSPIAGGQFDPGTMVAGGYTYTIAGAAPCPDESATVTVTVNAPPDPGTDGVITLCTSDAPVALFGLLGGAPEVGGTWSGPSAVVGDQFDPATMSAGVYTYTVAGTAPCPDASANVTVIVNIEPIAGLDAAVALCATSPAIDLFDVLGGSPDAGGTWGGPSPVVAGLFDPATMLPGPYTYTVQGIAPCVPASATVLVNVVTDPDPGLPGGATICASDAPFSLFTVINGTPDAGGSWSGPSAVIDGQFDPGTMMAGVYTYTITVPPPCVSVSTTVTIDVVEPPDAGSDAALTLCATSPATAMLPALGGTPDAAGTWSGPSTVGNGQFDPGSMVQGTYTYSVTGTTPCPAASAELIIGVVDEPNAGTPGSTTLCTSDLPIDLFTELGGAPDGGGSWSGPSAVIAGQFDPGSMMAGIYTYTISVPPPCLSVSSTVTVSLVSPPNAGVDGQLTLCVSSPAVNMLPSLGGTPDAGGSWSGPSPVNGGQFNPGTMGPGTYLYTVPGTAPCPATSSELVIDVVAEPDAGTPGSITLCITDAAIDLFAELGGTPDGGGSWSGPSPVTGGQYDPGSMMAGDYTYTITVPPPCVSVSSTVSVAVVQSPEAGMDGALTLCVSSPPVALIGALSGDPDAGGSWSGPSPVPSGQFNPGNMVSGIYTYTVPGAPPCPAAIASVEVTVVGSPDAGGPGYLTTCGTDAPSDLFLLIEGSPDAGGTWTTPSGTPFSGTFDPSTDAAGTYTYTITVPPPCLSVSSTVTVDVIAPPSAGTDAAIILCISSPGTPLLPLLGASAQAGGSWSGPSGSVFNGTFDPSTHLPGDHLYTVPGNFPCPADVSTVSVSVVTTPDPGLDGSITLCLTDQTLDLFSSLGGTPDLGGSWNGPNGSSSNGSYDPGIDPAGVYTYTINAPAPCSSVSSTVTVSTVQPPDAGSNGSITVCATGSPVELLDILTGDPDSGGNWTDPQGSPWSGTFDPTSDGPGTYIYTVNGSVPCPVAMAEVLVGITDEPNAGADAILNLCAAGDPVDVFVVLEGADPGGSWNAPGGMTFTGTFTPGADPSGDYVYTVEGAAPCPSSSATITIVQLSDPYAGEDGTLTVCSSEGSLDLFPALMNGPDPGGLWYGPNGSPIGGPLMAEEAMTGPYRYVVTVPPPCVNDTAEVLLTIVEAANAGENGGILICSTSGAIDLFQQLGGTPDDNGTWSGPGTLVDGLFAPDIHMPGNYTYTVQGSAPCPNVGASVLVEVEPLPDAGENGSLTVCPEAPGVDLFNLLGGTPDPGGSWTRPDGTVSTGIFDPLTDPPGIYTYTVFGVAACPDMMATSTVSVFVVPVPDAGPDQLSCGLSATLNATGTWASGTWSGPEGIDIVQSTDPFTPVLAPQGGSFILTWNVITDEGCTSSDQVTILLTTPIEPIAGPVDAICHGICNGTAAVAATGGNIGGDGYTYQWSNGLAGNVPQAVGICAGAYTVQVADTNGCSVSVPFIIGQPDPLVIDEVQVIPETCPGSCDGMLTVVDPEGVNFSLGAEPQSGNTFQGLCAGAYAVQMTDAHGCQASSAGIILSPPPVTAAFQFTPDTVFVNEPTVTFVNLSSPNAVTFNWSFQDLGSSNEPNPSFTFPGGLGGEYTVCLTAMDANGCSNEVCLPVPVLDLLAVHVPNAFSPNGDGINDEFLPIFNLPWVVDYQFMVFNRWGEQIFGTDLPGKPWNGDYSDVTSETEVYVWKLTCRDQLSGERIERIGHVTLLK